MKAILLTAFLFLFSIFSFSQTVLKGLVKDSRDEPIFAANVYLKSNAQLSTSTDLDGKFQLPISSMNDTLIVSFVGYKIKKISLNLSKPTTISSCSKNLTSSLANSTRVATRKFFYKDSKKHMRASMRMTIL